MLRGERLIGLAIGAMGALWIVQSLDLNYMGDFAPGSGFLPLWLGIALVILAVIFLATTRGAAPAAPDGPPAPSGDWRKPVFIALGLFACVGTIGWLGFAVPVAGYLVFLTRFVERQSWTVAVAVATGTTAGLYLVFRVWLGIPFPTGPWGF